MDDCTMPDRPYHTQIPNHIIALMPRLGPPASMVVIAVARKTAGWQKVEDVISISQFEDLTGLSRQGVITAIEKAIEVGAIARTPDKRNGFRYRLVNDVDQSEQSSTLTSTRSGLDLVNVVDQSEPPLVNDVDPQKKDLKERKKESRTPRKRSAATPPEDVTPIAIRQALAEACDVDITPGAKPPQKMVILLNNECKALWTQQQARGKDESATVEGIQASARYTRMTDRRFKDPATRIPIALIRENWTAAARWKRDQGKSASAVAGSLNGTNGAAHEPYDYDSQPSPYELRRLERAARSAAGGGK